MDKINSIIGGLKRNASGLAKAVRLFRIAAGYNQKSPFGQTGIFDCKTSNIILSFVPFFPPSVSQSEI